MGGQGSQLNVDWPARALIVDSDARGRSDIARGLTAYRVETATSVQTALPVIRASSKLHLAFVEFDLVDGCGFSLMRELLHFQDAAVRILLSTRAVIESVHEIFHAHAFVHKPFATADIVSIAAQRLGQGERSSGSKLASPDPETRALGCDGQRDCRKAIGAEAVRGRVITAQHPDQRRLDDVHRGSLDPGSGRRRGGVRHKFAGGTG